MSRAQKGIQKWGPIAFGVLVALLALWRLPDVWSVPSLGLGGDIACGLLLGALFTLALVGALAYQNAALKRISYPLGFVFTCFLLVGRQLVREGAFGPWSLQGVLAVLLTLAVYTLVLGGAITLLFRGMLWLVSRTEARREGAKPESRFSRLVGNGWFAFGVLLLCWVPVWLAFWPGTFRYDATTQFSEYIDQNMYTHHPLVHTLLLGWCLDMGLEMDSMAVGIAIYCGGQLVAMAGMLGYACHWLWRRQVPLAARCCVLLLFALLPLYPLWSFSATKDVLFGGLVLLAALQLMDLWQDGYKALKSPWRVALFVITCIGMMLFRHNGIYAFVLAAPFVIVAAKNARLRMGLTCALVVAGYLLANGALTRAVEPEHKASVEMLSIPLQQMARVVQKAPDDISQENWEVLEEMYGEEDVAAIYDPGFADPIKWTVDAEVYEEDPGRYLGLWARLGVQHPGIYLEAFLVQNTPYYDPGAPMRYHIELGYEQLELYPIEGEPIWPQLQQPYLAYDETLTLGNLPGSGLLSNTAWMVWLCLLCLGFQLYRKQWGMATACVFLLALWVTNLLGPVAIMRYMLGFFYCMPVFWARLLGHEEQVNKN